MRPLYILSRSFDNASFPVVEVGHRTNLHLRVGMRTCSWARHNNCGTQVWGANAKVKTVYSNLSTNIQGCGGVTRPPSNLKQLWFGLLPLPPLPQCLRPRATFFYNSLSFHSSGCACTVTPPGVLFGDALPSHCSPVVPRLCPIALPQKVWANGILSFTIAFFCLLFVQPSPLRTPPLLAPGPCCLLPLSPTPFFLPSSSVACPPFPFRSSRHQNGRIWESMHRFYIQSRLTSLPTGLGPIRKCPP